MLILLTGIDTRPPRIAGTHIENQVRTESVCPAAAVIPSLTAAASRAGFSYRIKDSHGLLGEAEEDVIAVTEAVIDPDLITVGIVYRRAALREIILRVTTEVRKGRIGLKELLHRPKN